MAFVLYKRVDMKKQCILSLLIIFSRIMFSVDEHISISSATYERLMAENVLLRRENVQCKIDQGILIQKIKEYELWIQNHKCKSPDTFIRDFIIVAVVVGIVPLFFLGGLHWIMKK